MKQDVESVGNLPKKYWYKNFIESCPLCFSERRWRERQYTTAPPKYSQERWDYNGMVYDWCDL